MEISFEAPFLGEFRLILEINIENQLVNLNFGFASEFFL
jgi:hypothetical protein